jgi:hypothetical protein
VDGVPGPGEYRVTGHGPWIVEWIDTPKRGRGGAEVGPPTDAAIGPAVEAERAADQAPQSPDLRHDEVPAERRNRSAGHPQAEAAQAVEARTSTSAPSRPGGARAARPAFSGPPSLCSSNGPATRQAETPGRPSPFARVAVSRDMAAEWARAIERLPQERRLVAPRRVRCRCPTCRQSRYVKRGRCVGCDREAPRVALVNPAPATLTE